MVKMPTTKVDMDGGFAWVILFGAFLNVTVVAGTMRTFGILYAELLSVYGGGSGNTAFLGSLLLFVHAITGPISGFICVHYSFRWCTMFGGLLAGIGMAISSLTRSVEMLLLTYSTLIGIGIGLSYPATYTIINFYFEKRRAFANGILTSSMGLACLVYPILYRKLIDEYGIHGAMLILGGILMNICVGGSFFRQPQCFLSARENSTKNKSLLSHTDNRKTVLTVNFKSQIKEMLNTYRSVVKNPSFLLYCIAVSFALVAYSSNFNILPAHIESQHFTKEDAVIVITVIGATELVARFVTGYLLDLKHFTVQTMFIITMLIGGIFSVAFTFFKSMIVNIIYSVIVGIFPGVLHSLSPLLIVSILGLKSLPSAFPLLSLFIYTACLIGHPFLGWLEDWTGSWTVSFYTMGAFFMTSSVCVFIERILWRSRADSTDIEIQTDRPIDINNINDSKEEMTSMLNK